MATTGITTAATSSSNKRNSDSTSNISRLIVQQPISSTQHRQHRTSVGSKINQDLTSVSTATTLPQQHTHSHNIQTHIDTDRSDNFEADDDQASNETCTIVSNWADDDEDDNSAQDDLDLDDHINNNCGWLSFRPTFLVRFATIQVFVFFSCILVTLQQALSSGYFNSVMTTIEKRFDIPSRVSGAIISTFELGNLLTILFVSYFGTHRHIPVWMGKGIVVTGIGSLLFALPHFINTTNEPHLDSKYISTLVTSDNNKLQQQQIFDNNEANVCKISKSNWIARIQNGADRIGRVVETRPVINASHPMSWQQTADRFEASDKYKLGSMEQGHSNAIERRHLTKIKTSACNIKTNVFVETHILIFMIAMMLIGCGGTPVFTLGTTFIDDHVPKESSSMYIGFMYSMVAFGLVIGFLLGGYLIGTVNENIYSESFLFLTSDQSMSQQQIHPGHPRWIGAWWLGFIILGLLLILVSLPFFAFPKSLKVTEKHGRRSIGRTKKRPRQANSNANGHDHKGSMIVINCDKGHQTHENIRTMSLGNQSFNELIIKRNHSMGAISGLQTNNNNGTENAKLFDNLDSGSKVKSSKLLCYCDRKTAIYRGSHDKQQQIIFDKPIVIENKAALCDNGIIIDDKLKQIEDKCQYKIDDVQPMFDDDINNNTGRCLLTECQCPDYANKIPDRTQISGNSMQLAALRPNWVSLANLFSANGQPRSPVVINKTTNHNKHIRQRSHDYKLLLNDDHNIDYQLADNKQQLQQNCNIENRSQHQLSSKLVYLCDHEKTDDRPTIARSCVVCLLDTQNTSHNNNQLNVMSSNHCCHHYCCCCHCCRLHNKQHETTTFIQPAIFDTSMAVSKVAGVELAHSGDRYESSSSPPHQLNYGKDLKDIPRCMWNLLINPIYIVTCLGSSLELAIVSGFLIFLPKYLETQFGLSKSQSSLYSGGIAVPGACFGILFGGYILKRYQMKPKSAIQFVLFINLLCIGFYTIFYFLGCPNPLMAGATMNYPDSASYLLSASSSSFSNEQKVNLTSQCNAPCQCSPNDIEPVCGQDGFTYFSPCHAGCSAMQQARSSSYTNNYSQCACVSASVGPQTGPIHTGNQSGANLRQAKSGPCPNQCQAIVPFMILLFFMTLVVSITQMPLLMITLRSVRDEERSFALGMQFVIFRLLAYIPAPILFGNVIDGTCLLWRANCGPQSGFCLIYDIEHFRLRYVGLFSALKVAAGLLFFLDWYLICWKSGAGQSLADQRTDSHSTGARMMPMGTIAASSLVSLDRMSAFGLSANMSDEYRQKAIIERQQNKQSHQTGFLHRQPH